MIKRWLFEQPLKAGALLLAAILVLAGCEAIGGLDINKALSDTFVPKAMEGKVSLAFDLVVDEKSADPNELAMLKLLQSMKLNLDALKVENAERMSAAGTLAVAGRNIPFRFYVDGPRLTFQVEGAKKPIVIDTAAVTGEGGAAASADGGVIAELQKKLSDPELSRSIMSYLIKQLPNPAKIGVSNVDATVHGESLNLFKLSGEVNGTELLPLVKRLLLNMMKDDQALKELIGQVYDALQPIVAKELDKMAAGEATGLTGDALGAAPASVMPLLNGIRDIWNDRETAIEVIHTEVKQVLTIATVGLAGIGEDGEQALKQVFNDTTYVKSELYFDHDLKLRKADTALMIAPRMANMGGVSAVHLTVASEFWNVNGAVKADPIDVSGGSLAVTKETNPSDLLLNLDRNSNVFKLLKDDLHVLRKQFYLPMGDGAYSAELGLPFIADDVTMVPTRYISDQLGVKVEWNDKTKTIVVTDPFAGTTIVIPTSGGAIAQVNGVDTDMGHEVIVRDDTSYVPLRFIVKALGGTIEWNDEYRMIQVTKE
ncbi:copper amine oxidase N-terminal domain-containing protein [Paenibacillus cymbidii]|uniref:copper amine oxidase N-terminal domain-containing protein n=1 Tax=Paenibacillus cymbidii TaxID=1639034 RepID=UPI0014368E6C|nr:copper amine oxidase N-terminal domain-containing protein [Paenibacillus cymbidii]